jgi:serine/threonine-protein kinase
MSYTPILELGEGGMGKVFLARAKGAGDFTKLVVLKAMRPSDLDDESIQQMFASEARLSARFNHPNLVQVQEVNLSATPPFLVMEYLDGKPMSELRSTTEVTLAMRLAILSEVLSGLQYAHDLCNFDGSPLDIVHRDVSPHNVFITCDGAVKVLDFGIARVAGVEGRTAAGEIKGKLGYMAPEQLLDGALDRRADVFSVGSMLWEAAVGKRMWEGVSEPNLMHRLATFAVPRPSDHGAVDPELEAIIVKATAGRVSERYQSARELQQALDSYRCRLSDQTSLRRVGALLAETFRTERRERETLISNALKESLRPAAAPLPALPANDNVERESAPSRLKWVALAALLLLAAAGFYAQSGSDNPPARESLTEPKPTAATGTQSAASRSVPPTFSATHAESVAKSTADAQSEGVEGVDKTRPTEAPGARRPEGRTTKPPSGDSCDPPYYFSAGIKMYKKECL